MCPKGDDPMTTNSNFKTIELFVSGPKSGFTGSLGIRFEGEVTYLPVSTFSSTTCKQKLEASAKFREVTCTYSKVDSFRHKFIISFLSWPITPQENNLFTHDGNPSINEFSCDISQLSSLLVSCTFTDLINTDLPGNIHT